MSGRPPVAKKRQVPEIRMNRMNDREELSMLKKWKENKLVSEWNAFWRQEEVIIFKTQITKLLENIFKEIESQSKEVY